MFATFTRRFGWTLSLWRFDLIVERFINCIRRMYLVASVHSLITLDPRLALRFAVAPIVQVLQFVVQRLSILGYLLVSRRQTPKYVVILCIKIRRKKRVRTLDPLTGCPRRDRRLLQHSNSLPERIFLGPPPFSLSHHHLRASLRPPQAVGLTCYSILIS